MSIEQITSDSKFGQSKNLVKENIEKLELLFPEIITDGKINLKSLEGILGNEIENEEERYGFTWPNKLQARRESNKPSTGTLRPVEEDSLLWNNTDHLYIEGDNLEVLKLLQKSYGGG